MCGYTSTRGGGRGWTPLGVCSKGLQSNLVRGTLTREMHLDSEARGGASSAGHDLGLRPRGSYGAVTPEAPRHPLWIGHVGPVGGAAPSPVLWIGRAGPPDLTHGLRPRAWLRGARCFSPLSVDWTRWLPISRTVHDHKAVMAQGRPKRLGIALLSSRQSQAAKPNAPAPGAGTESRRLDLPPLLEGWGVTHLT